MPEHEEWNVFSNWEPAQPGSRTRAGCESTLACAYILRSLDVRHDPGDAAKSGAGGKGRGKETFICKAKQFRRNGVLGVNVSAFVVTSNHQGLTADSHL